MADKYAETFSNIDALQTTIAAARKLDGVLTTTIHGLMYAVEQDPEATLEDRLAIMTTLGLDGEEAARPIDEFNSDREDYWAELGSSREAQIAERIQVVRGHQDRTLMWLREPNTPFVALPYYRHLGAAIAGVTTGEVEIDYERSRPVRVGMKAVKAVEVDYDSQNPQALGYEFPEVDSSDFDGEDLAYAIHDWLPAKVHGRAFGRNTAWPKMPKHRLVIGTSAISCFLEGAVDASLAEYSRITDRPGATAHTIQNAGLSVSGKQFRRALTFKRFK